jgi:hypothetical protein
MKNTNHLIITLVGVLILISSIQVFAQDWPQWRGVHRDGKVTGFNMPKSWPNELTSRWKIDEDPIIRDEVTFLLPQLPITS